MSKRKPSPPSDYALCLDDREHRVEDFYQTDECWACGLSLQMYWAWYTEGVVGELREEDNSTAASARPTRQIALPREDGGGVERFFG